MSLPRAFGTELGTVPAGVPYVNADSARRARWIERLRGMPGRKVGLAWAGNPRHSRDRYRSIELDAFAPLGGIEGVQFVSLQKDAPASWGSEPPRGMAWHDPTPELHDFEDTAALVDALDLVIAVDTAVLHLAGALGKPAWALLPAPPDFRWMDIGDATPWYPTMRLFRQRQRDDWNDVLRRVAIALQEASAPADRMRRTLHDEAAAGARGAQAVPDPPNRGAAFGTRAGLFAIAETRHGLLQYRPDDTPAGKSLDWYGEYLQAELDLLASLLGPGMTVIEVGAGIGAHSVVLAALLGADGHLMLYESDPVSRHVLQQNLSVAGATNVTIMRGMIGASPGEQMRAGAASESPGSTQARGTETLDDLGLARLDLLKVNASAGPDVLRGIQQVLCGLRPSLLVATRDHLALADAADRVRNVGYRCWRLATPLFNPGNFNRRSDDIFEGQAMLAMLALPEEKEVPGGLGACVPLC